MGMQLHTSEELHSINYQLVMAEQQQEQEKNYKSRLGHLKQYIAHLKHQINYYQAHHQTIPTTLALLHSPPSCRSPNQTRPTLQHQPSHQTQLQQEKAHLQLEIVKKEKVLSGLMARKQQNNDSPLQITPYLLKVYSSRARASESLSKLGLLLQEHDWEYCSLYQQPKGLVIVGTQSLSISKIKFQQIEHGSVESESKYLRFLVRADQNRFYTFNFPTPSEATKWRMFLNCVSSADFDNLESKWLLTQVKSTKSPSEDQKVGIVQKLTSKEAERKPTPPRIQTSGDSLLTPMRFNFKKKYHNKQETDKSSFYLSNSSDKNNDNKNAKVIEQMNSSFQFEPAYQEIRPKQNTLPTANEPIPADADNRGTVKNIHSAELQNSAALTRKLQTKMQEKRKLLSESSATRLGIHWHQDVQQKISNEKEENDTQKYLNSPTSLKLLSNHKSISSRNNQQSTRRDSNQSPLKRVESATRHKSNSRQSQEAEAKRKKTDFSLQLQKVEDLRGKKKSSKHEIRDHYLQKLIQKEAIKQISKSSGKDSSSQMQRQQNILLSIPQRRQKRKPSSPNLSRYGSIRIPDELEGQDSMSQQEKQSTELQIQIQELKNGIVLQKCSKDAWSTKQKKLYISNAMTEICYCDVHNSHEQKKYFIRDIKSIEYGRVSKGILKHKKKRCDEGRCLLIRIDNNGKQKLLQFYLDESEAVQNLQEFSRKLQNYVEEQNQQSENESD